MDQNILKKNYQLKMSIMIQLKNIDKYYDSKIQRTYVLKDNIFEVKEGEF